MKKEKCIAFVPLLYPGDFKKIRGEILNMYEASKKARPLFVKNADM